MVHPSVNDKSVCVYLIMPAHLECLALGAYGLSQALLGSFHFSLFEFQLLCDSRVAMQHLIHLLMQSCILLTVRLQLHTSC